MNAKLKIQPNNKKQVNHMQNYYRKMHINIHDI